MHIKPIKLTIAPYFWNPIPRTAPINTICKNERNQCSITTGVKSLKDKSRVAMINARKQIYQLLPRIMNFFPNFDARNNYKFVKHYDILG